MSKKMGAGFRHLQMLSTPLCFHIFLQHGCAYFPSLQHFPSPHPTQHCHIGHRAIFNRIDKY
uniref:Uncharacterized protein n=1 Tax=Lotus japonicus TaxID=34305 RepID=I3SZE4_LOTJA|nr:unknown [Lotus japonicus]